MPEERWYRHSHRAPDRWRTIFRYGTPWSPVFPTAPSLRRRAKNQEASSLRSSRSIFEKKCSPCRATLSDRGACERIRSFVTVRRSAYLHLTTSSVNFRNPYRTERMAIIRRFRPAVRRMPTSVMASPVFRPSSPPSRNSALPIPNPFPSRRAFLSAPFCPNSRNSRFHEWHTATFSGTIR